MAWDEWLNRTRRLWKRGLSSHLREQLLVAGDVNLLREIEAMPDAAIRRLSQLDKASSG
jgi:hypothetical protein